MEGRYSLLRIMLIDCHIRGRVTELKVDNHTNISGTNAAGKTTLQRLLPLFWGERPSNIQRRNKVKDPIPLFYLPRDSSLLVYEYLRGTGQTCQVLMCSDPTREKLQYRFVDKPYCETDYGTRMEDGKYKPGSVRDIGGNLRRKGIECSELLSSVQDYRAVIQNNRQYLRMNSKLRSNLSGLAHHYSMCDINESLIHMEKIVTAILSKHGKLDAMRQMVAQIIQENSQAFEAPKIDGAALQTMTGDIAMLHAFKSNQQRFDGVIDLGFEFNELIQSVCLQKSQILDLRPVLEDTIKTLQSNVSELVTAKTTLREQWMQEHGRLVTDKQEQESLKETTERRIDNIHTRRTWWSEQDINTLKADVESLPLKHEAKLSAEQRRSDLLEEVAADELKLESQKRKTLENFSTQQEKKQRLLQDHEDKLRSEESDNSNRKQQLSREYNTAVNDLKDRHREEMSEYRDRIRDLTIQIRTTSKNQEEESRLLTVESNHVEAEKTLTLYNRQLLSLVTQKSDLTTKRNDADSQFSRLLRDIVEHENEIHALSVVAYPPAGSLQEFLEESTPNWKEHIGRIIEPNLLHRTDLAPTLADNEDSNAMFGVTLRLNTINPPAFLAEKAALVIMIEEKENTLKSLIEKRDQVKGHLKKTQAAIENIELEINRLTAHITAAENMVKSCGEMWEMAKLEIQQAVERRKQETIYQQKSLEQQLESLIPKQATELELLEEQYRDQALQEMERWQGIRETIEGDIDAVKDSLSVLSIQKNKRILELEQDFQAALSEKGIDDQVIAELNQTIKALSEAITTIDNRKSLIRDFEEWHRDIWEIELPRKNTDATNLSIAITALNKSIEELDHNFKEATATINARQTDAEGQFRDYSQELERLQRIQREWGPFDRVASPPVTFSLSNIRQNLNEVQTKLNRYNTLYREVSDNIDNVSSIISHNGNAAITGAWDQLRDEAQQSISGLPDGQRYKRHAYIIERLPQLVYDQIANIENMQKSQAQRYGDQFKKLYDTLIGYHQLIDLESRKLGAIISENLDLEGISNAEIGLKSRIKELGYWGTLEDLVKNFEQWKETGFIDLPSDEFLSALSEMKNLLHKITGNIQLDSIFDLFIKIEENGKPMVITSDALLDDLSSNGMKYLILCKLYMGFTKMLNESRRSVIHWPVDELGELHGENIAKLFQMLNKNNVIMVGALPQPDRHLLGMFTNKYMVDKESKQLKTVADDENSLLAKLKQLKGRSTDMDEVNDVTT